MSAASAWYHVVVSGFVQHVVLQPKGAKGMDGVIQPVREAVIGYNEGKVTFDRFPNGEFEVVVVTDKGPQRYGVSAEDRAKIR